MRIGTTAFPAPPESTPIEALVWNIHHAHTLDLDLLNAPIPKGIGPDGLAMIGEALARTGIEIEPTCGANYCASGDEAAREQERVIAGILHTKALGGRCLRTMAQRTTNRFTKDPPLDEQLTRIITNLRPLAAVAAEAGITIALENHCDYRGSEIAQVIQAVDSHALRAALDTGNPFTSFEDPLDAAQALAPLACTTHLKDCRIVPLGIAGMAPWIPVGCALGEGNVALREILELLAQVAPNPTTLPLIVEVNWPPAGQAITDLMHSSVAFIRQKFADYLTMGA